MKQNVKLSSGDREITPYHRSRAKNPLPLAISGLIIMAILFLNLWSRNSDRVQAQTGPDPRFGIVEAFWANEEAAELNVGWERILFYWREIQPAGPDDWNTLHVLEEWLAQANSSGRTVVGLIKNTAPWASEDGTEAGLPKGLYLDTDDPNNLWANYVRKLASYYSTRNVHHWIVWNEPEIKPGVYGYEFAGSEQDYFRMLKVAYLVMKEVDPSAVIHLAGLTWWHDQNYLERLLDAASEDPEAIDNNFYFDVISLHIYFRSETVKSVIEEVNRVQERFNIKKPIWINETNAPPNRDPDWPVNRPAFEVDLEQQAWFVQHALALGFAAGAERISIYKLLDVHLVEGGESFGLIRPDFSRRPAFEAYKMAIDLLSGFTDVKRQQGADFFVITFEQPGKVTKVLWARTPSPVSLTVPAMAESAKIFHVNGEMHVISAVDGAYTLSLVPARCPGECIIGGPPIFLVEESDYPPSTTIQPATYFEGEQVTLVLATFTPTPSPTITRTPRPTQAPSSTPTKIPPPTASLTPSAVSSAIESELDESPFARSSAIADFPAKVDSEAAADSSSDAKSSKSEIWDQPLLFILAAIGAVVLIAALVRLVLNKS